MENKLEELLDQVILKSQDINRNLVDLKDMTLIAEKMEERNTILIALIEKAMDEGREDIFLQLQIIKKEEEKALAPYHEELNTLKQQLIKLNHTKEYLAE